MKESNSGSRPWFSTVLVLGLKVDSVFSGLGTPQPRRPLQTQRTSDLALLVVAGVVQQVCWDVTPSLLFTVFILKAVTVLRERSTAPENRILALTVETLTLIPWSCSSLADT